VDVEGSLTICAMKSVEVFDRAGKKRGDITLPERPANVAFGDPDRQTLYICARTSLYRARMNVPGVRMP
jgi:gluconolactonase